MNAHTLGRQEIENWREYLLDNEQRDEERVEIGVLCDMALEALDMRLRGAVNQQGCSRSEASVAAERTDRPSITPLAGPSDEESEAVDLLRDVDRHLNIVATERDVTIRNSAFDVIREAVAEFLSSLDATPNSVITKEK